STNHSCLIRQVAVPCFDFLSLCFTKAGRYSLTYVFSLEDGVVKYFSNISSSVIRSCITKSGCFSGNSISSCLKKFHLSSEVVLVAPLPSPMLTIKFLTGTATSPELIFRAKPH